MKLTCTSWSFPCCTLQEVAGIAKALGIDAIDVGIDYRAAIDRAALLSEPEATGRALLDLGVDLTCFYYRFGPGLADRNIADPAHLDDNLQDFEQIVRFCTAARIPTIFLLPGILNPGQTVSDALAASARSLNAFMPLAEDAGITLTIEAHVQSLTESPALVEELLAAVPGLKLTLDYSHFVCLGYCQEDIDRLAPHAAHVHLRQAKPGELQTKLDQGTINFPRLIATLKAAGYDGCLALENVHQDYMNTLYDDVLTETVRMRDLVRRYL